jgi:hypothetical protein
MGEKGDNNGRDERGRFKTGNPGGPGGARRRAFELQRAAEDAVTTEHVAAMVRKAVRMALEGNLSAMRLALDRTCGRAAETPAESERIDVAIPSLRTAADCAAAVDRLVEGHINGSISGESMNRLLAAVQARLKAIEVTDVEERLTQLEQAAELAPGRRT